MMFNCRGIVVLVLVVAAGLVSTANEASALVTEINWDVYAPVSTPVGGTGTNSGVSFANPSGSLNATDWVAITGFSVNAASIASITLPATSTGGATGSMLAAGFGTAPDTVDFYIDLYYNGQWNQVWTTQVSASVFQNTLLSTLGPITVPGGSVVTVSGIRLRGSVSGSSGATGAFTGLSAVGLTGGTAFQLDDSPNPEPATFLLVAAGAGGLAWHRRRQRKAVAAD